MRNSESMMKNVMVSYRLFLVTDSTATCWQNSLTVRPPSTKLA